MLRGYPVLIYPNDKKMKFHIKWGQTESERDARRIIIFKCHDKRKDELIISSSYINKHKPMLSAEFQISK